MLYRPKVSVSIDDKPLAYYVSELFPSLGGTEGGFAYHRLPTATSPFVAALMRPEVVVCLCLAYLCSKPVVKKLTISLKVNPKAKLFIACVALHNFILALFSVIVHLNSWPIALLHFKENGFQSIYCDQDGTFWNESGFGGWATIFYISKYYEFMDTWVLILKGKKPSFLQIYHHVGVALIMWGGVVSHSAWLLILVLLNSGIHTLMYTYFLIKTIYPTLEIKSARYLTQAQIAQFVVGITYTLYLHVLGTKCASPASLFAIGCMQLYVLGLIGLFTAFASRKYKKK